LRGGATQSLNDAHASVSKKDYATPTEFLVAVSEKVAKRVEQIRSGNVPGTRAPADPKAKAAREVVKAAEAAGLDLAEVMDAIEALKAKKAKSKH
jgi:hypothetical protein